MVLCEMQTESFGILSAPEHDGLCIWAAQGDPMMPSAGCRVLRVWGGSAVLAQAFQECLPCLAHAAQVWLLRTHTSGN